MGIESTWHAVGAAGEPAFQNGWVNLGGGVVYDAAFRKDGFGLVHLRGAVKSGAPANAVIFTLPAGYRPLRTHLSVVPVNSGLVSYVQVTSVGNVLATFNGDVTGTYLDAIKFLAEQ